MSSKRGAALKARLERASAGGVICPVCFQAAPINERGGVDVAWLEMFGHRYKGEPCRGQVPRRVRA